MQDTDLFRMALGIEPPWVVTKCDFDAAAKRLDIHLDFARGSRFACPECDVAGCAAYDSEEKTWRHLNFFQHEAYLHARVPRVTCKDLWDQAGIGPLGAVGQRLYAAVRGLGHGHGASDAGGHCRAHDRRVGHQAVAGHPPLRRSGS